MALTATQIIATSINGGAPNGTVVYSSSGNNAITSMIACNNSGSSINLTIYAVPSGKNPYNYPECTIVSSLAIPAGETVSFDQEKLVLGNGDSINATASSTYSGTGISIVLSTLPV